MRDELGSLQSFVNDLAHKINATDAVVTEIKARPRSGARPSLSVDTSRTARRSPRSARKRSTRVGAASFGPDKSPSIQYSEADSHTPTRSHDNSPSWTSSGPNSPLPQASTSPSSYDKQGSPRTPLSARRAGYLEATASSPKAERRAGAMYESPQGIDRFGPILSAPPPATPGEHIDGAVLTPSTGNELARLPETPESARPLLYRQGSANSTSTNSSSTSTLKRGLSDTCVQILPAAVKVRLRFAVC